MKKERNNKICFRNVLCKECPRNKKCTEESSKDKPILKEREKIHIDLSKFYK